MRHAAIAATNVRCAESQRRLRRLSRLTLPPFLGASTPIAERSAPRLISAQFPPARPNATAPGRRRSPSDDCSPRRSLKERAPAFPQT